MQLDLVDHRLLAGLGDDPLQVRDREVGHADGFRAALLLELQESPPGVDIGIALRAGPVDQVEIDALEPELLQARVEGAQGLVVALVVVVELRRDEQVVAGHPGLADRRADALLVAVDRRRVDGPIADPDGLADHGGGLFVGHLPHAEPELGHGAAVVEREVGEWLSCRSCQVLIAERRCGVRWRHRI